MKTIVFISHIHSDASVAVWLKEKVADLLLGGIDFFVSSDRTSIVGGDRWLAKIEEALNRASVVLVLCSKESVLRPWINFEAGGAWMSRKRVIPLCYADMHPSDLPEPLRTLQAYNLADSRDLYDLIELMAKEAGLRTPHFDSDRLVKTLPAGRPSVTDQNVAPMETSEPGLVNIEAGTEQRSKWIKSQVLKSFDYLDEDALAAIHEKLRPQLSEEEKSAIVDLLIGESTRSESNELQFLSFLREYSLVEHFKPDWKGRGEYSAEHGDRLLNRVLELCTSRNAECRENTTHVLRQFGGRLGITISTENYARIAESLISLAEDENVSVVRWALPAIGDQVGNIPQEYHGNIRSIVEKSLTSDNPEIRAAGTWALGHVSALYRAEASKLLQLIFTQLHDKNGNVIDNAIIALDWLSVSASSAIGEFEEDLYARLIEIGETSGGARLERIGSLLEKIGRSLPEPLRNRYEEKRQERSRLEREMRQMEQQRTQSDKAED